MSGRIYIAARFSRRPEANELARKLMTLGHTITSRWVLPHCDHVLPTGLSQQAADFERERFASEDIEDLKAADAIVSLQEPPRGDGRGGRHVEFGYALALGHQAFVIGPRETVFHHLPEVRHYESVDDFLTAIGYPVPASPELTAAVDRLHASSKALLARSES